VDYQIPWSLPHRAIIAGVVTELKSATDKLTDAPRRTRDFRQAHDEWIAGEASKQSEKYLLGIETKAIELKLFSL